MEPIKSNERSKYSYIGFDSFFSRKSLKICSRSVLIFRGLTRKFSRNSKRYQRSIFFFEGFFSKENKSVFLWFFASITLCQLSVGYVLSVSKVVNYFYSFEVQI